MKKVKASFIFIKNQFIKDHLL